MGKTIGSFEAKTKLSFLLDQVAKGETITITKRGRPMAQLVPIREGDHDSMDEAVSAILELRKRLKLAPFSIRELISKGRR